MMVFSGVASQCEERGALPAGSNFEIADTLVPAGTLVSAEAELTWSCVGLFPLELRAIGPDAVKDDGQLASYGDPGFLWANSFDELASPGLQWRWTPHDGKKHVSCFEEAVAREMVASLGDAAVPVEFS